MKNTIGSLLVTLAVIILALFSAGTVSLADSFDVKEESNSDSLTDDSAGFDESKFGDINNDGVITADDARILLRCSAQLDDVTPEILLYGDYDKNSAITAADARTALRVSASLENKECILHGHNFNQLKNVAPDCVNEGYTTKKCSRCYATDGSKTAVVKALGHKLQTTTSPATCTKGGWMLVKCTVCNHVEKSCENGKALGHSLGEWTESGNIKTRSCNRCNYSESQKIENKNQKVVYLTFDDGPNMHTEKLLNYLRKYNIKATFFVTNQNPKYIPLLKIMAQDGHAIGVHSLTHDWNIYSSEAKYLKDFNAMYDIIKKQTGIETKIFRFPGGTNNTVSRSYSRGIMTKLAKNMTQKGFVYFDWNVDCYDTQGYSSSGIANATINQIKNKKVSIVLMHDIKRNTVNAIPQIIEYGLKNGYVFKALDENSPKVQFKPAN